MWLQLCGLVLPLVVTLTFDPLEAGEVKCPPNLSCGCQVETYDGTSALDLDCRDRMMHSVPEDVVEAVQAIPVVTLDLSKNKIKSLSDRVFSGMTFERVYWGHDPKIKLDNNPLTLISPQALQGMTGSRLTLSFVNCSLGTLPKQQLAHFSNLTGLDIRGILGGHDEIGQLWAQFALETGKVILYKGPR